MTSGTVRDHFSNRHYATAKNETGPLSFLNPTQRAFDLPQLNREDGTVSGGAGQEGATDATQDGQLAEKNARYSRQVTDNASHSWRSRDNRKGRHGIAMSSEYTDNKQTVTPPATNTLAASLKGIIKMFVRYPIWDVSYDVATIFTIGSVVWCINGFFVWLPLQSPNTEFVNEEDWGGGITAFIGATIFEFGSVLLMLEAVNENRSDCFGWALEEAWDSHGKLTSGSSGYTHLRPNECQHHHHNRRSLFKSRRRTHPSGSDAEAGNGNANEDTVAEGFSSSTKPKTQRRWEWWPTWHELRTHYFREIGFLACASQMFGASVFWIAGLTGLPPILNALSVPAENGIFWLPQVIGGSGFIVSSFLFMLETQDKWYLPAPKVLGWHIGFWNLIGGLGFTLCGALGFGIDQPGVEYASTLATFVGSWAFLIGSVIQWFESLDKYPVSVG